MAARFLRWLALAWTLTISIRYLSTVRKSFDSPFNPGDDFTWLKIWLTFVALTVITAVINRAVALRVLTGLLVGLTLAMVVLSGSVVPFLIALWVASIAVILGDLILIQLGLVERENLCDRFVIALPLGLSSLALAALLFAFLGLFSSAAFWVVFVAITIAVLKHAAALVRLVVSRFAPANFLPAGSVESSVLFLLASFVFVLNFSWSVAPEVQYDTLNMRLAVPQIFLREGAFVDLHFFHSYFVHLMEFLYGFCMALHGEAVAKFLNTIIGVAAALSVYSLGRLLFSPSIGLWAAVFFYTNPLASWVSGTAYTDLAVAGFVTACLISFLLWYRAQNSNWLSVTGLLAGAAIGVKLNAAFAVIGVGLVLLAVLLRSSQPLRMKMRCLDSFVTLSALVAFPWYVVTLALTGNPIFPLLNGIFRSPKAEFTNTVFNAVDFGVGTSVAALLRLPFRLTFDTIRFGEASPRGSLGALLLFFIPFGILLARKKSVEVRAAIFVTATYLVLWAFSFQYGRYYLAALPGIAVLAVAGVQSALPERFSQRLFFAVLIALLIGQVAVLPLQFWNISERFPTDFAFGLEERESFLNRALIGYGAAQHLNTAVADGDRVLAIGFEDLRFYLKPPMESLTESLLDSGLKSAVLLESGPELARALAKLGFSHLMVGPQILKDPPGYYPYAFPEFLRRFAALEYVGEGVHVYRLKE